MQVFSRSPLPVASVLWQPREGRWIFTVVCKATFLLKPGNSPLSPEQEAPHAADVHLANDEPHSLAAASDLVPFKRSPEILVTGSIGAPGGNPVTSLRARVSIGSIDKRIDVFGDRYFTPSGELTSPASFTRIPLVWERAAG